MNEISLLSFPLEILCIDDDRLFLKAILRTIGSYFNIKTFNSSITALNFLQNYKSFLANKKFFKESIESENYDSNSQAVINLNITDIADLSKDVKRFNEIGVLIVDYKMPDLNGIELFRKIKNIPMKKILLTGEAESPEAVVAFNEGIIDRYIRKDAENFSTILKTFINELSKEYLYESTKHLLCHIEGENALSNPIFQKFFYNLCAEKSIREYYLIDKFGSFYLIDHTDKVSYLIIHMDKTLNAFADVYRDVKWAEPILSEIKKREVIPFFGQDKEPWEVSQAEWDDCFYLPSVLEGEKQLYYIAHIEKT